jgi:site-specific recombinase XerD
LVIDVVDVVEGVRVQRIRALIVILWRAGLRVDEALSLAESDLEPPRGSILVRCGRGGKRREVAMDEWGREQIETRRRHRPTLPVGPFLCVLNGPTRGRAWSQTGVRAELRRLAVAAGMRRRFAPRQLQGLEACRGKGLSQSSGEPDIASRD